jgi:hypothetical protein
MAVPAAPALTIVTGLYPLLEQLLADVALMGIDRVVGQVQRPRVRVRLAVEVVFPRAVLLDLGHANGRIPFVAPAAATAASSAPAATAAAVLAASTTAATLAVAATATATSIPVLQSL